MLTLSKTKGERLYNIRVDFRAGIREESSHNNKGVHHEDITIINIYTPNNQASKCMKHNGITHSQHNWAHKKSKEILRML